MIIIILLNHFATLFALGIIGIISFKFIFLGAEKNSLSKLSKRTLSSNYPPIYFSIYKAVEFLFFAAYSKSFLAIYGSLSKPNPFLYI